MSSVHALNEEQKCQLAEATRELENLPWQVYENQLSHSRITAGQNCTTFGLGAGLLVTILRTRRLVA